MAEGRKSEGFFCDAGADREETGQVPASRVLRFEDFSWEGVVPQEYKDAASGWLGVARHEIAGRCGERTAFHLRYFEVGPGGYSSLERHRHEHVVVIVRGRGRVRLGEKYEEVEPLDAVYVSPNTPHQFLNPYGEPFGFLCIVDAERDAPERLRGSNANAITDEARKGQ
jgi:quercetin dioxygenase-like cupin family protein